MHAAALGTDVCAEHLHFQHVTTSDVLEDAHITEMMRISVLVADYP